MAQPTVLLTLLGSTSELHLQGSVNISKLPMSWTISVGQTVVLVSNEHLPLTVSKMAVTLMDPSGEILTQDASKHFVVGTRAWLMESGPKFLMHRLVCLQESVMDTQWEKCGKRVSIVTGTMHGLHVMSTFSPSIGTMDRGTQEMLDREITRWIFLNKPSPE